MTRFINADALPYKTHKWRNPDGQEFEWTVVDKYDVDNTPTVDIEAIIKRIKAHEPKGEWIPCTKESPFVKCSNCGEPAFFYEVGSYTEQYITDYCPNCGAYMKGGTE